MLKVEVLGAEQRLPSGARYQEIAVTYPGRRYPVEDKMFLRDGKNGKGADSAVRPGLYSVDANDLVYPGQYNRLSVSGFRPGNLKPVTSVKAAS